MVVVPWEMQYQLQPPVLRDDVLRNFGCVFGLHCTCECGKAVRDGKGGTERDVDLVKLGNKRWRIRKERRI